MTRAMDSGALTLLNEILQLGGGGEQTTTLDDGNVSQVLSIEAIVRRSLTFANTSGWFVIGFENVHVGAGALNSFVDPYASTTGRNSYPTVMPRGLDVWLLTATMRRSAGAGGLTGAVLELLLTPEMQGKGTQVSSVFPVGLWDTIETISLQDNGITEAGETLLAPKLRLRRDTFIRLRSNAAGAATFTCLCVVGVFPAGLGQDVAG